MKYELRPCYEILKTLNSKLMTNLDKIGTTREYSYKVIPSLTRFKFALLKSYFHLLNNFF